MILSKNNLASISKASNVAAPENNVWSLPEKVLQFGTGVLLRGLPDHIIDSANRQGIFNGRIVVVKSTDKGTTDAFSTQDNLYTLCVRGLENGQSVDKQVINASISRVLSAKDDWNTILDFATSPDLKVVISNTTETGIKLVREGFLFSSPAPSSFPGKLLLFLYKRYRFFKGSQDSGLVILPTELISENGRQLKTICVQLAEINHYESDFIHWLESANDFCNTLVDRIVPGALPEAEKDVLDKKLGYTDDLMIMAEPYRLWAIETNREETKQILSFATADSGVIIASDINKYKELKLRLLNATHTYSCAVAIWCGFPTVKEAMANKAFKQFMEHLIGEEIIPAMVSKDITEEEARKFAADVLDRFANPFIAHLWVNISAQFSSKISSRCVQVLVNYYQRFHKAPSHIAMGFAAYLLFMNSQKQDDGRYVTLIQGEEFLITDDKAPILHKHFQLKTLKETVHAVLKDDTLWDKDLTTLPKFEQTVLKAVELLKENGAEALSKKENIIMSTQA